MNIEEENLEFAKSIVSQQSFSYNTLDEAKKTLMFKGKRVSFDALSLCIYRSEIDDIYSELLMQKIHDLYQEKFTYDEKKKLSEYSSLLAFLVYGNCGYRSYSITKEERPDFVLVGDQTVGIEVVKFTTELDSVLHQISNEYFGKGKTAKEIQDYAEKEHGSKANIYTYRNISSTVSISSPLFGFREKQEHFAAQIIKKREKYENIRYQYDRFILLCDARMNTSMSSKDDSDKVISMFLDSDYDLTQFDISILRGEINRIACDSYRNAFDLNCNQLLKKRT